MELTEDQLNAINRIVLSFKAGELAEQLKDAEAAKQAELDAGTDEIKLTYTQTVLDAQAKHDQAIADLQASIEEKYTPQFNDIQAQVADTNTASIALKPAKTIGIAVQLKG